MSTTTTSIPQSERAAGSVPRHGMIKLVNRLRVEMIDALDRKLADYDISAPQLIVLSSLANGEGTSAAGLCKSISYDPGAMTRMIDRLEQRGLIRRVRDTGDRRLTNLQMTDEGKRLYPRLLAVKDEVQAQFLRGFSKEEIQMLEGLLNRMVANR
jgi:MarR family transcriptional regulator, multiple antibiotic resistance protein MarR